MMRSCLAILTVAAGLIALGLMLGGAIGHPAYDAIPSPYVNCSNESANDGPDTPERDITPAEWNLYCA